MRGFGKWHAEHMNPRPDERVVRLMRHLREAFDIFEQLTVSAPVKPADPVDDKQLYEATIRLEQAQQRAAQPDVPMIVKPKAALKLMSISSTKLYEMILRAIAAALSKRHVRTPRGGDAWQAEEVRRVLGRLA